MDALKKTGQAKHPSYPDSVGEVPTPLPLNLELEPLGSLLDPAAAPSPASLPGLPADLAILDDEFNVPSALLAPAAQEPSNAVELPPNVAQSNLAQRRLKPQTNVPPAQSMASEREAAQNVFQVTQSSASNKLFPVAVSAFSLIAVAVIGLYFWVRLRTDDDKLLFSAAGSPPLSQSATPVPAAAPTGNLAPASKPRSLSQDTGASKESSPGAARPVHDNPSGNPVSNQVSPVDLPVHITTTKLHINPLLLRGYEAFSTGNLEAARSEYALLLNTEPRNGEALLALAAISLRLGQHDQAEQYYLRAIEADPKDALAQSGLIALRGQADLLESESRLKSLMAAQPALPFLHLVLGNLYARQGRWNEAQQEYFMAHSADREDPDVIFNLAVSLDRLHQPVLAAQYYSQALAASANRSAGFDPAQVNARLRDLSLVPN